MSVGRMPCPTWRVPSEPWLKARPSHLLQKLESPGTFPDSLRCVSGSSNETFLCQVRLRSCGHVAGEVA